MAGSFQKLAGGTCVGVAQCLHRLPTRYGAHFHIALPPLEEQRRIAEILDTIDETIQATERVIAKLRHAETAVLVDAIDFARADAQLGDVCSLLQDGTHLPPPRTSEGPLLLSVQNLDDGQLQLSARDTHVSDAFWRSTRRALPIEPGDVCLAVVGATLGKLGVVPPDLPRFTVQRSLTVLRGDPMRMRNDYLLAVMRHGEFQRNLWQRANQTAQPGVYLGELRTVRVPAPSLSEQRRVAGILNTINETIRVNREQRGTSFSRFDPVLPETCCRAVSGRGLREFGPGVAAGRKAAAQASRFVGLGDIGLVGSTALRQGWSVLGS